MSIGVFYMIEIVNGYYQCHVNTTWANIKYTVATIILPIMTGKPTLQIKNDFIRKLQLLERNSKAFKEKNTQNLSEFKNKKGK